MYKHISVNVDQSIFILTIYHIDVVLRIVYHRQLKNNEVIIHVLIGEFGFDNIKQIWHNIALKFILIRFTVITQKVKYYQCINQENFHVQMKRSFIKFIWDISITFCTFSFYRDFQPFISICLFRVICSFNHRL